MKDLGTRHLALLASGLAGILVAACGGGAATPTSAPPQPTATTRPAVTPTTAASATVVSPAATPTRVAATPTPGASGGPPTPVVVPGKRGGILQRRSIVPLTTWDTYDSRGAGDFYIVASLMNNLVWTDPYGDGATVVGDLARSWETSADGKTFTFSLRKGVAYHDGTPFTAKDVAYNLERAWKPRSATMTILRTAFAPMQKAEAVDDLTVRVTLSDPSNAFFGTLTTNRPLMYPAHFPFPEKHAEWKQNPIGTGPFKFKSADDTKIEFVRNSAYFREGLPYLDGVLFTMMLGNDIAVAAMRAGKIDVEDFVVSANEFLYDQVGAKPPFVFPTNNFSVNNLHLNNRAPFTDQRARQAISLALDRQAIVDIWLHGRGSPYTAPLLPPERGGQWGISLEVMKKRAGFRSDKTEDLARAKQLLADAGIDPTKFTVNIVTHPTTQAFADVTERSIASLGFKTKMFSSATAELGDRRIRGDFDVSMETIPFQFDDPSDYLGLYVQTSGGSNWGKWSNPKLDALFAEQDRTLDVAKRRQLLLDLQEIVLSDSMTIPGVYRDGTYMYLNAVKNYPSKLRLGWSPWYRYEQVWLER